MSSVSSICRKGSFPLTSLWRYCRRRINSIYIHCIWVHWSWRPSILRYIPCRCLWIKKKTYILQDIRSCNSTTILRGRNPKQSKGTRHSPTVASGLFSDLTKTTFNIKFSIQIVISCIFTARQLSIVSIQIVISCFFKNFSSCKKENCL